MLHAHYWISHATNSWKNILAFIFVGKFQIYAKCSSKSWLGPRTFECRKFATLVQKGLIMDFLRVAKGIDSRLLRVTRQMCDMPDVHRVIEHKKSLHVSPYLKAQSWWYVVFAQSLRLADAYHIHNGSDLRTSSHIGKVKGAVQRLAGFGQLIAGIVLRHL